jgi:hypothetical protein
MQAACLSIASCTNIAGFPLLRSTADVSHAILARLSTSTASMQAVETDGGDDVHVGQDALDSDLEREASSRQYVEQLRLLHYRRPFISKTGFAGSVPQSTLSGDVVCIFLGGKVPYIIRPVADDPETYIMISEAFVYGITNRELVQNGTRITFSEVKMIYSGAVYPVRADILQILALRTVI